MDTVIGLKTTLKRPTCEKNARALGKDGVAKDLASKSLSLRSLAWRENEYEMRAARARRCGRCRHQKGMVRFESLDGAGVDGKIKLGNIPWTFNKDKLFHVTIEDGKADKIFSKVINEMFFIAWSLYLSKGRGNFPLTKLHDLFSSSHELQNLPTDGVTQASRQGRSLPLCRYLQATFLPLRLIVRYIKQYSNEAVTQTHGYRAPVQIHEQAWAVIQQGPAERDLDTITKGQRA
ncbi:uncharacterized protein C8R40DRAFT_1070494 [Lentinula edodes]|uniref:uncharacterized protein n=1 Tax=Lentinula edodes TaxID=5353 RepID=UPI001E8EE795|nr:uncharacterized protein C8R40DRAFT_1070494 [Lentinula edodes]KAH7873994.1 hypothetical protein C8R40DRAFT_1070494 [Lentinula edodes]